MAAGNQQKHLEFTFSIKALPFHSRASIHAHCRKSRGETFFNETAFLFWCHALWKLGSSNCCIFEMKQATGMETCTKIYFLFIFNLVKTRIRKTSLFWVYNFMTSLWKPSIQSYFNKRTPKHATATWNMKHETCNSACNSSKTYIKYDK